MAGDDAAQAAEGFATGNPLLDALLKPGSSWSPGMLAFLDKVFVGLLLSIGFLFWLEGFRNIHIWVFLGLALGLIASVRFFISELHKAQADGTFVHPSVCAGEGASGAAAKKEE